MVRGGDRGRLLYRRTGIVNERRKVFCFFFFKKEALPYS
jgi:hypothetical protein